MFLFGIAAALLAAMSLLLGYPVVRDFVSTGTVLRLPTALLATGTMILAVISLFSGLLLDSVTRGRKEAKLLRFLSVPGVFARVAMRDAA